MAVLHELYKAEINTKLAEIQQKINEVIDESAKTTAKLNDYDSEVSRDAKIQELQSKIDSQSNLFAVPKHNVDLAFAWTDKHRKIRHKESVMGPHFVWQQNLFPVVDIYSCYCEACYHNAVNQSIDAETGKVNWREVNHLMQDWDAEFQYYQF